MPLNLTRHAFCVIKLIHCNTIYKLHLTVPTFSLWNRQQLIPPLTYVCIVYGLLAIEQELVKFKELKHLFYFLIYFNDLEIKKRKLYNKCFCVIKWIALICLCALQRIRFMIAVKNERRCERIRIEMTSIASQSKYCVESSPSFKIHF